MRALGWLVVAGCEFTRGTLLPPGGDGGTTDDGAIVGSDGGGADAAVTAPDAFVDPLCFGADPFAICLPSLPQTPLIVNNVDINTSGNTACHAGAGYVTTMGGASICVLRGTTVDITNLVGVFGSRPLVLLASDTLTVSGDLDVSSFGASPAGDGPDANAADCPTAMAGGASSSGAGGGAGASFGATGGAGGAGSSGGAAGGTPGGAATTFDKLRGGCRGGQGGAGPEGPSSGGSGGGAVYLVARTAIRIFGSVNASGAGGRGGVDSSGGGGGGGSGGMIVLYAPSITVGMQAEVFANGGGGGGGARVDLGGGAGGVSPSPSNRANGGTAPVGGSDGGLGGDRGAGATSAAQASVGGGGGGGSVGVIRVRSGQALPVANVSPAPILN